MSYSPESALTAATRANGTVIEGQKRALELALHGAPLSQVLEEIVRTVEAQSSNDVLGSILLLDADGRHLRHGAAPSLPPAYSRAIDGIAVGPEVGSCGTAAFTGRTVVVPDVSIDPKWAAFKALAAEHGLRACWSTPILSSTGAVLGTFALYHRVPAEPTPRDRQIVELFGHTAALVIERELEARRRARAEAQLEAEREHLKTFLDNLPELAWTARPDGYIDHYNRRWYEYTGTTFAESEGWGWQKVHDPVLLPTIIERWNRSLSTGEPFEMELTLRASDGIPRWFLMRAVPVRDASGAVVRWFGINTNIQLVKSAQALTAAVAEQRRDTEQLLLAMRSAKERAERRVAELEAGGGGK